jgi:hypothetical protein
MRPEDNAIARLFKKSLPSGQQEKEVGKRVLYRLLTAQAENPTSSLTQFDESRRPRRKSRPFLSIDVAPIAAAASVLLIVVLASAMWKRLENPARNGTSESVIADAPDGKMLTLSDGSQVEMQPQSELQVHRADDGLRIRLKTGSVIVTAAKQGAGRLYVETKDVVASVVGTVFLVSVVQAGSRVGVFDGVVNVQHGAASENLSPGQQMATNAAMGPVPLETQVSWSRNPASLLALLRPSVPQALPPAAEFAFAAAQSQPAAPSQNRQEGGSLLIFGAANNNRGPSQRGPAPVPLTESEQAMEQALKSNEAATDLPFMVEANYFQSNRGEYTVPITLKIPGSQLARSEPAKRILLDLFGEVKDDFGATVQNLRDAVDVQLTNETAGELSTRQITYEKGFTLLPGRYSMKFLVHDGLTGRIGTYQTSFVIPNLMREQKNLAISSVVLSSELVNSGGATSNSAQPSAGDPLIIQGKKLVPSVNRTFRSGHDLIVFLQAYEPNATGTQPLTGFVSLALYRGQTKVFETLPFIVREDPNRKFRTLPAMLRATLPALPAGPYDCQVTVVDPTTQKSAVWRSAINVVN